MIAKEDFINRIRNLSGTIKSKTGKASYRDFVLKDQILSFVRVVPKTIWSVNIQDLWKVYSTQQFINTSVVKAVIGGRANSPSVAILIAIGCIDKNGERI